MKSWGRRLRRLLARGDRALQVGAICRDPETGQVLMITSRGTGRWIIPKGWTMRDRSLAEAALQEAWEEAGVRASEAREIGSYRYDKLPDDGEGPPIPVEVRSFLVPVLELAEDFPEQGQRTRRWMPPSEAATLVAEPELAALLRSLDAPNLSDPPNPAT